jgi:hypothetical protein
MSTSPAAAGYFNNNVIPSSGIPAGTAPGSNQFGSSPYGTTPGNTAMPVKSGGAAGGFYNPVQANNSPPANNPYQAPTQGSSAPFQTNSPGGSLRGTDIGANNMATPQQYPWLGNDFATYLAGQIGQGMSPFNQATPLPTGGSTAPGQLTAPLNPMLQQLMQALQGGQSSMPGANTLNTIASQGISALPEWQSMVQAQQQGIQQGQANLQEQFAGMGNLAGSPFGTAMSDYSQQTQKDQNALLGQLQQQNILQGQIPVAQGLQTAQTSMAGGLQQIDQNAIGQYLQQFQQDQSQNNPMNSMIGNYGALFPPTTKSPSTWQNINSTIGALQGSGFSTPGGTAVGF